MLSLCLKAATVSSQTCSSLVNALECAQKSSCQFLAFSSHRFSNGEEWYSFDTSVQCGAPRSRERDRTRSIARPSAKTKNKTIRMNNFILIPQSKRDGRLLFDRILSKKQLCEIIACLFVCFFKGIYRQNSTEMTLQSRKFNKCA